MYLFREEKKEIYIRLIAMNAGGGMSDEHFLSCPVLLPPFVLAGRRTGQK